MPSVCVFWNTVGHYLLDSDMNLPNETSLPKNWPSFCDRNCLEWNEMKWILWTNHDTSAPFQFLQRSIARSSPGFDIFLDFSLKTKRSGKPRSDRRRILWRMWSLRNQQKPIFAKSSTLNLKQKSKRSARPWLRWRMSLLRILPKRIFVNNRRVNRVGQEKAIQIGSFVSLFRHLNDPFPAYIFFSQMVVFWNFHFAVWKRKEMEARRPRYTQ